VDEGGRSVKLLLLLFLAINAHAANFAIYLHDLELAKLNEVLQRRDLTPAENMAAGTLLPYGLQEWPKAPFVPAPCSDGSVTRRVSVAAPAGTLPDLVNLLKSIARRVSDPRERFHIEAIAVMIQQCGETDRSPSRPAPEIVTDAVPKETPSS
jgi:hypothetical protein